jgi:hypothetical protein
MQNNWSFAEKTAETLIDDFVLKCIKEGYNKDEVVEGIREFYRQSPEVGRNIFDRAVLNYMGIRDKINMKKAFNLKKVELKSLAEKMMPGQKPYTKEELKNLYKMVGDAAKGDPGEKEEEAVLKERDRMLKEKKAFIDAVKTVEASIKNKMIKEFSESVKKDIIREKIGKNGKWIKTAQGQAIEVDGKWYNENMEEIPNPNTPKSIEFNIRGESVVLKEGERYKNYFGNYLLKSIDNTDPQNAKVTVEYLDGQFINETKIYPAKSQAEAIFSEKNRVRMEEEERAGIDIITFNSSDEFFTLGYLAKNSRIIVEVPKDPKILSGFETKYKELTGEDAAQHLQDASYYIAPKQENRWLARGRLIFPIKESVMSRLSFPSNVNINNKGGRIEINNNNYIYNLFRQGFRMGRNEGNYGSISSGLSGSYKDAFDQGFNA